MKIYDVTDKEFSEYGRVLRDYDFSELLNEMKNLPNPEDSTIYVMSDEKLENLKICETFKNSEFGGIDIQIGYCNGRNTRLNCLEYHKTSELNVFLFDAYLILGKESRIKEYKFNTADCKIFFVPAGTGVEIFATTLHYAPCHKSAKDGFIVAVVLPRGTNGPKPEFERRTKEDEYLTCNNKWLLAHKESAEAENGAKVALEGENIDLKNILK